MHNFFFILGLFIDKTSYYRGRIIFAKKKSHEKVTFPSYNQHHSKPTYPLPIDMLEKNIWIEENQKKMLASK